MKRLPARWTTAVPGPDNVEKNGLKAVDWVYNRLQVIGPKWKAKVHEMSAASLNLSASCRKAAVLTAALMFHASLACAANTYILGVKELQPQILSLGKGVKLVFQNHVVHYTIPSLKWDIVCQWNDPLPVTVTKNVILSLGMGCSVQNAGSGFIAASILTQTNGLSNWHIIHQGDAAAGRASSGKLFTGKDVSRYDPCKYGDAKPTVTVDVILSDGGNTRALLARYIYQGH